MHSVITANLGNRYAEVKAKGKDGTSQNNYKHYKSCIFKISQLELRKLINKFQITHKFLTSRGLNSTRQPIGEPGGGGLNLIVNQLVDWIFYSK